MAIKIKISNIVGVKVEGTINDEAGMARPFDFSLTCDRLTDDEADARIAGDYGFASIMAFMLGIIKGWSGVRGDDDKALDYSGDAFRELCAIHGVLFMAYRCYREQTGVKAKN